MILLELRLHPFGCFADREVRFEPGLNVVLGPNEAGKSTLFHAARTSLLRTSLDRKDFAKYIARFLPAGGGDTVGVEIAFEAGEGRFSLKRRWGPSPATELVLPDGAVMTDDEAVRVRLESVLPAPHAALWKVLFTSQTELAEAVESLQKKPQDALSDLSDILRRSTLETGGVSPDRFRAALDGRIEAAFDNWDAARGCPRANRGIDNPWQKKVGEILTAYYERESILRDLKLARELERQVDETNRSLGEAARSLKRTREFLQDNRRAHDDARERMTFEADLRAIRAGQGELTRLATQWPVEASEAARLIQTLAALTSRRDELGPERELAAREEENARLRERFARVQRLAQRLSAAEARVGAARSIGRADVEEIRAASGIVEALGVGLEASTLRATLTARAAVELDIAQDTDSPRHAQLGPGETITVAARGHLRVGHRDLDIEIRSGGADAGERAREVEAARARLARLLAAHGVSSLGEADELERAHVSVRAEVEAARAALAEELGGETLEALSARGAALGPARSVRPLAEVAAELAAVEGAIEARSREQSEREARILEWRSAHGSLEGLISTLADEKSRERGVEAKLAACAPLPQGYQDTDAFILAYEEARKEQERLAESYAGLRVTKAALEARMPEQSAEELETQLRGARAKVEALLERGQALLRVREEATRLLASSDASIYAGMRDELGRLVAAMTSERYAGVEMEGALPSRLVPRDGPALGWDRLSAGTRDLLALALRLVMASRFLGGARGFVMMDDPLVEMDPERQGAAAAALRSFAAERQLVVFTCHPRHAELLGGSLVTL